MNANWNAQIVRSLQKKFQDDFTECAVVFDGQVLDPGAMIEWVTFHVDGPRWLPGRSLLREAEIDIDVNCFCQRDQRPHRLQELSGAVCEILDRVSVEVFDYPAETPASVGWVRLMDAKVTLVGAPLFANGDVPLHQVNVSVSGRVEIFV